MPHAYPLAARAFGARNLPRLALKSDYGRWAYKSVIIFCFSLYRVRSSKLAYHCLREPIRVEFPFVIGGSTRAEFRSSWNLYGL